MKQRRLKIIGISIPVGRPLIEAEIVECHIENPFQQTPLCLSLDRIAFFIKKGKIFYYLDSHGQETQVKIKASAPTGDLMIQTTTTETPDSLLYVPLFSPKCHIFFQSQE